MPHWNLSIYANTTSSSILDWLARNTEFVPSGVKDIGFTRQRFSDSFLVTAEGEPYEREMVYFETVQVGDARTQLRVRWRGETAEAYAQALLEAMAKCWPEVKGKPKPGKRGPTLKAQERATLYQKLKDAHPEWSYAKVAQVANSQESSSEHTEDTVRNAYRAMGWAWERADRIR